MALQAPVQASHPLIGHENGAGPIMIGPERAKNPVVLVVDDDESTCEIFERAFGEEEIELVSARNALQAFRIARHLDDLNALIVEHRLPDLEGLELVRKLLADGHHFSFILMSGCVTVPVAVEAMQLGATTVLEKPCDSDDLLVALRRALIANSEQRPARPPWHGNGHASGHANGNGNVNGHANGSISLAADGSRNPSSIAERWAMLVLRAIPSPVDFRTLDAWARTVHLSRSALTECCRLVHVAPRDARDFTRLLRAICHTDDVWQPEAVMDFADERTLRRVLRRAGLTGATEVPTVEDFFDRQQWVAANNPALVALRMAWRDRAVPAREAPAREAPVRMKSLR